MRLLLDTHVFVWACSFPEKLPSRWRAAIAAPGNNIAVSAVTAWEIAIKRARGRLSFPLEDYDQIVAEIGFEHLAIISSHAIAAGALPAHHRDPFDRMLVAQARVDQRMLVTRDSKIALYDVERFAASP